MADAQTARAFLYRWRRWLIVLGVLVVLRAALPEVLRRVIVSQASQKLATRVEVGDVDLRLWRGGVALEDVALYSPKPESPDEPPLVAWKRFAVELRYFPLFWKTAQLRSVTLDTPRVALDRLADGELNLRRLVPPSEEEKAAEPAAEEKPASPWKMGIDHFALRAGGVRFRDLTLTEGEPLEIAIPDISVDEVGLQPGLYGEPGRARIQVKTEGGSVRVESRLVTLEQGFELDTRVKAFRLPLRRARLYVPGVGWSEVRGELDLALDHALAPGGRNEVRGMVRLRDVAIEVPELAQAAFGLARFAVWLAPVDLAAHRASVSRVEIGGLSAVVDLRGGDVLPLLRRKVKEGAEPPPAAAAEEAAPAEPAAPSSPWHWALGDLHLGDSKVVLLPEGEPLEIGVDAKLRRLSDEGDPGHVELRLAVAPGSLAVDGAIRPIPGAFGGTVKIEQLPLHDLGRAVRAAANIPHGLLQAATLAADLALEAGLTVDGSPAARADALRVKGSLSLEGVDVKGPDPNVFSLGWKRFAIPVDELEVPGVVPGAPVAPDAPIRVGLGEVRLESPTVQVTRSATGILLPPPLGPSTDGTQPATPPPAPPAEPPAAEAPKPARPLDLTVSSFTLEHGWVGFADQTVKPFFWGKITPLEIDARGIRSQGPVVERFKVAASTPLKGQIDIAGSFRPEGGSLTVDGKQVALTPYNPYVTTFSSYSLGQGAALTVKTDIKYGKGNYDTKTAVTLHRLTVKGAQGDTLFKQQFGIPLSMALALLRDLQGNIKLDIPVAVDQSGTKIGLGTVVSGALRSAILGAVTSPLKGLGAVLGSGGEASLEPPPIAVDLGRAVVTPEGEKQVGQLAELLAGRPGVAVELDAVVTPADVRWLREQDLRAELEARTGMVNALRDLPERRAKNRIVAALTERAAGKPGEIDHDDQEKLDEWLAERPALPPERVQKLAAERGAAVKTLLRDKYGIQEGRVSVSQGPGEPREGQPVVLIVFGAVEG